MPISDWLDMMPETITMNVWVSQDVTGKPTYSSTGVPYRARVELKNRMIVDHYGKEVMARGRVFLATATTPSVKDKVTLPTGYVPVSPPILAVNVQADEAGGHHVVLEIG